MRPFIEKVRSNVKSPGSEWEIELARYTYIRGPNGGHKTTIIQAAELATTGAVDDIMGRDEVKKAAILMSMKPEHEEVLVSSAVFSDGSESSWTCDPGKNPKKEGQVPSLIISRIARKLLSGSAERLHESMLDWLNLDEVTEDMVTKDMSPSCRERYQDVARAIREGGASETEILSKAIEYSDKRRLKAAGQVKAHAQILSHYQELDLDGNVTDEDIFRSLNEMVSEEMSSTVLLHEIMKRARKDGYDQCPACGTEVGSSHIKQCEDHYRSLADSQDSALMPWVADKIKALFIQRARWESLLMVKEESERLKAQVEEYSDLKKACRKSLKRLVEESIEDFCQAVTKYLPEGKELGYDSHLGWLGLKRLGGGISSSMSGAEWATVTAAVGCAIGERTPAWQPLVLVIEDRAWDPETLRQVMLSLQKFPGQVLMQGTIGPKGRFPPKWTMVSSKEILDQFCVKTIQPTKEVSALTKQMLVALGFDAATIDRMSPDTAIELSSRTTISSAHVTIHEDGGWSLTKEHV